MKTTRWVLAKESFIYAEYKDLREKSSSTLLFSVPGAIAVGAFLLSRPNEGNDCAKYLFLSTAGVIFVGVAACLFFSGLAFVSFPQNFLNSGPSRDGPSVDELAVEKALKHYSLLTRLVVVATSSMFAVAVMIGFVAYLSVTKAEVADGIAKIITITIFVVFLLLVYKLVDIALSDTMQPLPFSLLLLALFFIFWFALLQPSANFVKGNVLGESSSDAALCQVSPQKKVVEVGKPE